MKVTYQQRVRQRHWFFRAGMRLLAGGIALLAIGVILFSIQAPAHTFFFISVGLFGIYAGSISTTLLTRLGWSRFAFIDFVFNQLGVFFLYAGFALMLIGGLDKNGPSLWGFLVLWGGVILIGLGMSRFHSPISSEGQPIEDGSAWSIHDFLAGRQFRKSVVGAVVGLTFGLLFGLPGRIFFLIPLGAFVGALVGVDKGTNHIGGDLIRVLKDALRFGLIGMIIVTIFCTLLLGLLLGGTTAAFTTGATVGVLIGSAGSGMIGAIASDTKGVKEK